MHTDVGKAFCNVAISKSICNSARNMQIIRNLSAYLWTFFNIIFPGTNRRFGKFFQGFKSFEKQIMTVLKR
jgi:hypothetical protein